MSFQLKREMIEIKKEWRRYYEQTKLLRWAAAVLVMIVYGIRLAQGDLFIDSEIMLTDPEKILHSWYGSRRYGLVFAKRLLAMGRLAPYVSNAFLVLALWGLTMALCFCFDYWSGRQKNDFWKSILFALFFLSSPCFVEQFNFLLQAFEIALALLLCLAAVFCAGRRIYEGKSRWWLLLSMFFMVWSFGFYQALPAFYIALTVISYIEVSLHGTERCGFREGISHVLWFLGGFALYCIIARTAGRMAQADSSYVNGMVLWGKESLETCISNLRLEFWWMYQGNRPVFYEIWFPVTAGIVSVVSLFAGWGKAKGAYLLYAFAVLFLPATPFLITLITGMNQPIRGQMVYPLVYAYMVMTLYGRIKELLERRTDGQAGRKAYCLVKKCVQAAVFLVWLRVGWLQCMTACQLWETAHESYVQDVLTANRMYWDICDAAGEEQAEDCMVVFVGERGLRLSESAVVGDAIGYSFFEWDADSLMGVNERVHKFFETLGLKMEKPEEGEYQEALKAAAEYPVWPAKGSAFKIRDGLIGVKLSEFP